MKIQITMVVDETILAEFQGFDSIEQFRNEFHKKYEIGVTTKDIVHELLEEALEDQDLDYLSIEKVIVVDENESTIKSNSIFPILDEDLSSDVEVPTDVDLMEFFEDLLEEKFGKSSYDWVCSYAEDEDDLPDGGWTSNVYVKRGNRTFELEIEFETQWCGDWSVRANLPDGFSLLKVTETSIMTNRFE